MQRDDPIRIADTRAWLTRAASDLRGADLDLAADPPLLGDALFHCQQAVEKALKGLLAWHDVRFRKTHDLREVGGQVVEIHPSLEDLLRRAAPLTEYAWKYRYPGEPEEPERAEAEASLSLAREVYAQVLARLPGEVGP
jgi:HEPN domain-containing protein